METLKAQIKRCRRQSVHTGSLLIKGGLQAEPSYGSSERAELSPPRDEGFADSYWVRCLCGLKALYSQSSNNNTTVIFQDVIAPEVSYYTAELKLLITIGAEKGIEDAVGRKVPL